MAKGEWKFECDNCDKEWTDKSIEKTKCPQFGYDSTRNCTFEKEK